MHASGRSNDEGDCARQPSGCWNPPLFQRRSGRTTIRLLAMKALRLLAMKVGLQRTRSAPQRRKLTLEKKATKYDKYDKTQQVLQAAEVVQDGDARFREAYFTQAIHTVAVVIPT